MRLRLALPFAFVGAAPFVTLARPFDALVAALAMGAAGAVLRGRIKWSMLGSATTVAGGVGGILCGSFAWGVLLGLIAVFPLRLVAWAAEGGIARRGSVLDDVDVRQAWGVAAVLVTIVPSPLLSLAPDLPGLVVVIGAGLAALVGVTFADLYAFGILARLAARAARSTPAPLTPVHATAFIADVGIGERQHEQRMPGAPYRGSDEIIAVVRGDTAEAQRQLGLRLMLDVGLVVIAALLFTIALREFAPAALPFAHGPVARCCL